MIPSKGGRWLAFTRPDRWRLRAVADRRRRRTGRTAHGRSPLHLGLGRGPARVRQLTRPADRLPALDADRAARPVAARAAGGSSPSKPRRLTSFNAEVLDELELRAAGRAPRDGRRPRHPGLADPRRRRPATARRPDPRRPAHALRLVAVVGVPAPRRRRDRASSTATRAAPRATARRSTTPTTATGARVRRATSWPASTRSWPTAWPTRSAWLTGGSYGGYLTSWIVGHDQRFRAAMTCRSVNDMGDPVPDRRHRRRRLGPARIRHHAVGRTRPTSARSRRSRMPTRSGRRC